MEDKHLTEEAGCLRCIEVWINGSIFHLLKRFILHDSLRNECVLCFLDKVR